MNREPETRLRGRIVASSNSFDDGVISVRGERIVAVQPLAIWVAAHPDTAIPAFSGTLIPGLVDIHNHGGFGYRFDTVDPDQARGRPTITGGRAR